MRFGVIDMDVTARIKLFEAADAAEEISCVFQEQGNNLCGTATDFDELREGVNAFLPYKNEGSGAEAQRENSFNKLGLFNFLGSDKNYQYRFGITGTDEDIEEKGYRYELNLTVESVQPDKKLYGIVLHGDYAAEQFPMKARYCAVNVDKDGVETDGPEHLVSSENVIFTIKFAEPARKVKIKLDYWNRPQYNACLTAVLPLSSYYILDRRQLLSVETKTQMCENSDEIKYGTLPGDGSIEAYDYYGEICELLKYGIISNESIVEICAGDTLVQRQLIMSSDYNSEDKSVKFTLGDKLALFEEVNYVGMRMGKYSKSLLEILKEVLGSANYTEGKVENMCKESICPQGDTVKISVKEWLDSIIVPFPYLEADTLRATLDKICVAAQLFCYCDFDGELKFVSARPQSFSDNDVVRIPKERTYGNSREDVFPKLKYDAVESTVKTLSLKSDDEVSSATFTFYESNNNNLTYQSDWEKDCDADTAIKFANNLKTEGTPDLIYFEKTFDVEPSVFMNNAYFEVVDNIRDQTIDDENTIVVKKTDEVATLKQCDYDKKNSFLSEYYNNGQIIKDPTEKKVVMGYCYNTTKCTVMMFVPVSKATMHTLKREIKLIADNYEVGEVTNHYYGA